MQVAVRLAVQLAVQLGALVEELRHLHGLLVLLLSRLGVLRVKGRQPTPGHLFHQGLGGLQNIFSVI